MVDSRMHEVGDVIAIQIQWTRVSRSLHPFLSHTIKPKRADNLLTFLSKYIGAGKVAADINAKVCYFSSVRPIAPSSPNCA